MKKQLKSISPLRAGIVLAVMYGIIGCIILPFFLIAAVFGAHASSGGAMIGGAFFAIFIPIFYAIAGFIGGVISAFVYNLVAKWTGGLEFEVEDVPASM